MTVRQYKRMMAYYSDLWALNARLGVLLEEYADTDDDAKEMESDINNIVDNISVVLSRLADFAR